LTGTVINASVDANLRDWSELKECEDWDTLVIGNGASINVWPYFDYKSLYEAAERTFDQPTRELFSQLGTQNFEEVLAGLSLTKRLTNAAGESANWTENIYSQVRDGLLRSVREAHIPWIDLAAGAIDSIGRHISSYSHVFSLNYDLLLYWSVQSKEARDKVRDFMWSDCTFSRTDVAVAPSKTKLHFVHGALHLWQDTVTGICGKWKANSNLLEDILKSYRVDTPIQPLFVSEGSSQDKLRSIRRSDYLSFSYDRLVSDNSPTVILGTQLSDSDQHIVNALKAGPSRTIAIAIYPHAGINSPDEIMSQKLKFKKKLNGHRLLFVNSKTHPLGSTDLRSRKL